MITARLDGKKWNIPETWSDVKLGFVIDFYDEPEMPAEKILSKILGVPRKEIANNMNETLWVWNGGAYGDAGYYKGLQSVLSEPIPLENLPKPDKLITYKTPDNFNHLTTAQYMDCAGVIKKINENPEVINVIKGYTEIVAILIQKEYDVSKTLYNYKKLLSEPLLDVLGLGYFFLTSIIEFKNGTTLDSLKAMDTQKKKLSLEFQN